MKKYELIIDTILEHYPDTEAIYVYGTYGTADEWPDSDIDIAVLLPPKQAKEAQYLAVGDLRFELEAALDKKVDLVNLRRVPTVLQKEVIAAERRIYCSDAYAADEFEMLTLSYYQKLNQERAEIIEDALKTGRIIK
jgi:predicted nucleotidyltransferase